MNLTERKIKKLGRLFNLHQESLRQALRALESGKPKIAVSVLKSLAVNRVQIRALMREGQSSLSLSVQAKLKELFGRQQSFGEAFAAAIKTGSLTEAKNVLSWLGDVDSELAALA